MKCVISYPIPLHFVGSHGARLCDVVEIDGVPHAVVETSAASFSAIRLDPTKIRDLQKEGDHDRVRCFYLDAVTMNRVVEIPGKVVLEMASGKELEPVDQERRRVPWWATAWIPLRIADSSAVLEEALYIGF